MSITVDPGSSRHSARMKERTLPRHFACRRVFSWGAVLLWRGVWGQRLGRFLVRLQPVDRHSPQAEPPQGDFQKLPHADRQRRSGPFRSERDVDFRRLSCVAGHFSACLRCHPRKYVSELPKMLHLLTHNCNLAKGFYGVCPHKRLHKKQETQHKRPAVKERLRLRLPQRRQVSR